MPQVPQTLDALAVRTWCGLALEALGRAREEIDAINVYPVADGDTGTNLYLTVESAAAAVEAVFAGYETVTGVLGPTGSAASGAVSTEVTGAGLPTLADAVRAMAHGALIGARGNSGTILAQLLRGMAQVLAADGAAGGETDGATRGESAHTDGQALRLALRQAADSAREAVAHPVEGTVLTVATAAAEAATGTEGDCGTVACAAYEGARAALMATPGQLAVLERAGVVDAGGRGLLAVLAALAETFTGESPGAGRVAGEVHTRVNGMDGVSGVDRVDGVARVDVNGVCVDSRPGEEGPAFEVTYLLEAEDADVARLRARLDRLGNSLVVVGGDGLWNVHVHADDAGAAVEAGVEAGRPYRIRITHFGLGDAHTAGAAGRPPRERAQRAVVAVVPGEGLAGLYAEAGATTVLARPGEPPASGELVEAVRRAHAREVVLLPNDADLRHTAAAAAEQARTEGVRVALIPTRSAVQGIAALAVHEPERRFDEDVVAMTSAAGATRYAEVAVAERQSWTMAGICQEGDVLGLIDGDVAVIGSDITATAETVLDRMLAAGGEMVTLVLGDDAPGSIAAHLEARVRESYLAVDTVAYRGGRQGALLLIGVE
ncbi:MULTISPECIES: DAK2 domain-containing protein [unclassified Streptomyces]|uniref:DAK2 domain-containing protein n=1 Tax=unclassified Streptomyces TaxID=2593676 RepID=UPI001161DCEB|nr:MULTISPECIES: DAK2 domain-containing protein [unclassified Streptomyces]NMI61276.1 DAK2 domain-containing protein [Streptomyces sp. RLA2-12]QDN60378.1 DAK2 domain-containing protein [Streptomyces sp. S1D4-20]QDN70434.1 DAK2 domain-containing protein [Streptomyces sp. S1D4-14]QDO52888.1 DAK2 domain-containing protein [Streptomyces sp. RLB3-5]QDO63131.1 DAK2 domain-containing protein [Streptomyces sp. RLB1-8]